MFKQFHGFIIALTFVLFFTISASTVDLTLLDLSVYPKATCLDGLSPGGRFDDVVNTPQSAHKLVIAFEGGGWVHTEAESYARSKTALGSSTLWPKQQNFATLGIWSSDCNNNPLLCTFTRAYLKYCDGTSFGGTRSFVVQDTTITHHGDYILRAHLIELFTQMRNRMKQHQSTARPEIIVSGCSAGGLAAVLNTWSIGQMAREILGTNDIILGTAPCSGLFLEQNNVNNQSVYQNFMDGAYQIAQPRYSPTDKQLHPCFLQQGIQPWQCLFAENHLPITQYPIFLLNSVVDSWSIQCIFTSDYPLSCGKTSQGQWAACSSSLSKCTPAQVDLVQNNWIHNFMRAVNDEKDHNESKNSQLINSKTSNTSYSSHINPNTNRVYIKQHDQDQTYQISLPPLSGGYLTTCWTHCDDVKSQAFKTTIDGTTSPVAIAKWWQYVVQSMTNTKIDSSASDHIYLPCSFRSTSPFQCNLTCPTGN